MFTQSDIEEKLILSKLTGKPSFYFTARWSFTHCGREFRYDVSSVFRIRNREVEQCPTLKLSDECYWYATGMTYEEALTLLTSGTTRAPGTKSFYELVEVIDI